MSGIEHRHDIEELEDIRLLVNTFYEKVRKDELLGGIFNGVIRDRWPEHLEKMYRFWQTILHGEYTYQGRPFPPHARLPVERAHFDRWLALFIGTVDELFEGSYAEEAKWRARKMAELFRSKIEYFRDNNVKPVM